MYGIRKKFVENFSWVVVGNIAKLVISLLVSIMTARYLGPSNYGKISYVTSFCSFFTALCTLGINSVLVKELLDHKEEQGEVLGSSLAMRMVSTVACMGLNCVLIMLLNPTDKEMWLLAFVQSFYLFFSVFDSINYWFQARLQAKVTAIVSTVGYSAMAIYRIYLLATGKSLVWFAAATSLDTAVVAILLLLSYYKNGGQKFSISFKMGKSILSKSCHFIIAGLMVSLYAQMDKVMINQMIDSTSVGYYTTAYSISGMWTFVIGAIIETATPIIYEAYNTNRAKFRQSLRTLYAGVIWICVLAGICMCLLAKPIVAILYGEQYFASIPLLRILVWSNLFSYLGVAKNIWIVCENKNKYLFIFSAVGAAGNIVLNLLFIPWLGSAGAAIATVLTQVITSIVVQAIIPATRDNCKIILEAFIFKDINIKNLLKKQ